MQHQIFHIVYLVGFCKYYALMHLSQSTWLYFWQVRVKRTSYADCRIFLLSCLAIIIVFRGIYDPIDLF